ERTAEVAAEVRMLLAQTSLAGAPVLIASAVGGRGIEEVRAASLRTRDLAQARDAVTHGGPRRLAIDRAFAVRGRGAVVTGTLRTGSLAIGETLRVEPAGREARIRGLHVHHAAVEHAAAGRVAVNLAGVDLEELSRGSVLTNDPAVVATDRLLVALARPMQHLGEQGSAAGAARRRGDGRSHWPPVDGSRLRLHIGTAAVDAIVGRRGREGVVLPDGRVGALLRLSEPIATFRGDRAVLRQPSPGDVAAGVQVLDPHPPRGLSRRRVTADRLASLAVAIGNGDVDAIGDAVVGIHGAIAMDQGLVLAPDVREALDLVALEAVGAHHRDQPLEAGPTLASVRAALSVSLRRLVTVRRDDAVIAEAAMGAVLERLVSRRQLLRDEDRLRDPERAPGLAPELVAAMDRLEAALAVPAPPPLGEAARAADCPPAGVRALESQGRIVRVDADLAWAAPEFHRLAAMALSMARRAPLAPATLRDATGTSRRVVMPLLEDLGRRGILERTPEGHVPGPRAPRPEAPS
ncbi:MAG: SelB C-terminal domain-containing protein, partial [Candidatus Limnocylindrales bacterium]